MPYNCQFQLWIEIESDHPASITFTSTNPLVLYLTPHEKINTTHDRSYDYKLSGGKYYYSTKGQNNWVEAKGTGINAIKSKVKF